MPDDKQDFISVDPEKNAEYRHLFDEFPYFENYIHFVFDHAKPEVRVNDLEHPTAAFFYNSPAYLFVGDPDSVNVSRTLKEIPDRGWILASNVRWNERIRAYYGSRLEIHPRTQFSAHALDINHVKRMKRVLPDGIDVVKIDSDHVKQESGIFHKDVLKPYFAESDFMEKGFGFCAVHQGQIVGFAASNFPIRGRILEVIVVVEDSPEYRRKGLGITLSATLIEHCLEHGIEPIWDAANQVSAHMAEKLGYSVDRTWEMYRLLPLAEE